MTELRKLKVDGVEVEVPAHYTLLQACEEGGAEIPRSASTSGCRSPAIAACAWSN
jgi:NADH dehydrogenase/NADH:ubiquinone oxidoreductase subunit G